MSSSVSWILRSLVVAAVISVLAFPGAGTAWTPKSHFRPKSLSQGGPLFWNYDGARNLSVHQRDFPVDLVFTDNASVKRVGDLFRPRGFTHPGSNEYEPYGPQGRPRFDRSRGNKTDCDSASHYDQHFRYYAPGGDQGHPELERFKDAKYGYVVVGSAHVDHGPTECGAGREYFGFSETVEDHLGQLARYDGYAVSFDAFHLGNQEGRSGRARKEKTRSEDHYWQSDGKATKIRLP